MKIRVVTLLLLGLVTLGCSKQNVDLVYKMDRQQGNYLSLKMLEQVKEGMTKEQVHYLLGSPAIIDNFHPDEWYYVYSLESQTQKSAFQKLVLVFKENHLAKIDNRGL